MAWFRCGTTLTATSPHRNSGNIASRVLHPASRLQNSFNNSVPAAEAIATALAVTNTLFFSFSE